MAPTDDTTHAAVAPRVLVPDSSTIDDFDALLIDIDGTLVHSAGPVRRSWEAFARRKGLDAEEVIAHAQGRPSAETVAAFVAPELVDEEARLVELHELTDTEDTEQVPGAAALLRCGRPLAVVTSCSRALSRVRMAAAGLRLPEIVVTCDDVKAGKPDPECYLLAASRLGVAPERCLVFEDSPSGVRAGRAAGARVIAVRSNYSDDKLAEADAIVDDLTVLTASRDGATARPAPR